MKTMNGTKQMEQAFVITAYKDFLMLRLICELLHETFKIYVHVDALSTEITEENIKELNQLENINAIRKYECHWNSYNHLLALIELAKKALEDKSIKYVHFSSGEDLPIRSAHEIKKFFETSGNKSFINFHYPDAMTDEAVRDWWKYYHFFYNGCDVRKAPFSSYAADIIGWQKKQGICKSGLGSFTKIYKGVIWSSFTREALEFCFNYAGRHPEYVDDIKYTRIREEFYFHTILFNEATFQDKIQKDGKHGWHWKNGFSYMTMERYQDCLNEGKLFIRKVNSGQEDLINCVLENSKADCRIIGSKLYRDGKIIYQYGFPEKNGGEAEKGNNSTIYRGGVKHALLMDVTEKIPINRIVFHGDIKNRNLKLNICGKNLFDPYKILGLKDKRWLEILPGNVLHYINSTGENQRVSFGTYAVIPGADIVISRDNDNVSVAVNELNKKGEVVRQSWLGATGVQEKAIKFMQETVSFSIIATSDKWVKKVDERVRIQVEYGTARTAFEEHMGRQIPFLPDSNHYILPHRIEQKEKLFIWLDTEYDVCMEADISKHNPAIAALVDEIEDLRCMVKCIEERVLDL